MKPLTAAGILLLVTAIIFASFFQVVLDALSSPAVLLSLGLFALAGLSFGVSRLNPKHGYAIAVVLVLIGGGIIASTVVLYEVPSQIGCLGGCGDNGGSPFITGSIIVNPGSHNGTLTLEFRTFGTNPPSITSITVANANSANYTALSNITSFQFMNQGNPVSTANPLPWGQTATDSMGIANVTVGTIYELSYLYTLSNGSHGGATQLYTVQN